MIKCVNCNREISPEMKYALEVGKCPFCGESYKEKKRKITSCSQCPHYSCVPYRCHNEVGYQTRCALGYMDGEDTRDWNYRLSKKIYEGCCRRR